MNYNSILSLFSDEKSQKIIITRTDIVEGSDKLYQFVSDNINNIPAIINSILISRSSILLSHGSILKSLNKIVSINSSKKGYI